MVEVLNHLIDAVVKIAQIAAPILLAYIVYRENLAAVAAKKVEKTLEKTTALTERQYGVIHDFLNHERRVLLEKWARAERVKAGVTGRQEDLHAAADAGQKGAAS
jgi:hypothetical protein